MPLLLSDNLVTTLREIDMSGNGYVSGLVGKMMREFFDPGKSLTRELGEECPAINVVVTVGPGKDSRKVRDAHIYLKQQEYKGPKRIITVFNGNDRAYHDSKAWDEVAPDISLYSREPLEYAGAVNAGIKEAEKYGGLTVLNDGDTCFTDSQILSKIAKKMKDPKCAGGVLQVTPAPEYSGLPGIKQFYGWNTFWADYTSRLANIPLIGGLFPATANGMLFFRAGYRLRMDEGLKNMNDVYLLDDIRKRGKTEFLRTDGVQTAGDRYESNILKAWADKFQNGNKKLQGKKEEMAPLSILGEPAIA